MKIVSVVSALCAALLVTACGGGGSPTTPPVPPSKVAAYLGQWVAACQNHEIETMVVSAAAGVKDGLTFASSTNFYTAADCSGAAVGTRTESAHPAATYTSSTSAAVVLTAGVPATSLPIDLVAVYSPGYAITIAGPGVTKAIRENTPCLCMDLGAGSLTCYAEGETMPAFGPVSSGMYASGNKLYMLGVDGAGYKANGIFTRK